MNTIQSKVLFAGIAFVVIFLSGFWMSHAGKPYSSALSAIHKLASLAVLVLQVLTARQVNQIQPLNAAPMVLLVLAVLCFVALIASGAMLTLPREFPAVVRSLHHILPWLALASSTVDFYLLLKM